MVERIIMTNTNQELLDLVTNFVAKSKEVTSSEEVEALNKEADQKLLEMANGDQETFLNLRKQAATLMTDQLIKEASEKIAAEAEVATEDAAETVEDAPAAE